jgi:hypothetical protein
MILGILVSYLYTTFLFFFFSRNFAPPSRSRYDGFSERQQADDVSRKLD